MARRTSLFPEKIPDCFQNISEVFSGHVQPAFLDFPPTGRRALCFILLALVPLMLLATPISARAEVDECPAYIWISVGERIIRKNGSVTRWYYIRTSPASWTKKSADLELRAFYRLKIRQDRSYRDGGYYHAPVMHKDNEFYLEITCGTSSEVELLVAGKCGCRQFTAKAVHAIHGKSSEKVERVAADVHELPADRLVLRLTPMYRFYHMQTGETCHFNYMGRADSALVFENQKQVQALPVKDGAFSYTPPHDPRLDSLGHQAYKEIILLVEESTPGADLNATHALYVHRSIYGHNRLGAGLMLLAATILLTNLILVCKRRRSYF